MTCRAILGEIWKYSEIHLQQTSFSSNIIVSPLPMPPCPQCFNSVKNKMHLFILLKDSQHWFKNPETGLPLLANNILERHNCLQYVTISWKIFSSSLPWNEILCTFLFFRAYLTCFAIQSETENCASQPRNNITCIAFEAGQEADDSTTFLYLVETITKV